MKSYFVWVFYILIGILCLNNPATERLPQQWGFFMMLGSGFLVMYLSGFMNLGMSFQMIASAIAGAWSGCALEPSLGPWAAFPALIVFVLAAHLAGWFIAAMDF
jgi:ABC-type uncharacterized transport system permease subunit